MVTRIFLCLPFRTNFKTLMDVNDENRKRLNGEGVGGQESFCIFTPENSMIKIIRFHFWDEKRKLEYILQR